MYDILNLALTTGEIMLKNGSETYRVQNTIEQILRIKKKDINTTDILVVGTGIIITLIPEDGMPVTMTRSISKRVNNLEKISLVSDLAKQYSKGQISIEQGLNQLYRIDKKNTYSIVTKVVATCLGTAAFTVAFGGTLVEGFFTFIATIIPALFINVARKRESPFFLSNMLAGAIVALLSLLFLSWNWVVKIEPMIASVIIILTPGVVAVTAIRDMVNGDFITGASRGIDALIQAASLALGVAGVFTLWYSLFGGIQWIG